MTAERDWTPGEVSPPEGIEVETMDSSGRVSSLVYEKNLWWLCDRSMYVYYIPRFWRAIDGRRTQ